jgi:hypothetical protein
MVGLCLSAYHYSGPEFRTPIWDPNLGTQFGTRFGTPIWDPDLGPRFGTRFGTLIWGGGGDMGPPFGTLIWDVIWGALYGPEFVVFSNLSAMLKAPVPSITVVKQH